MSDERKCNRNECERDNPCEDQCIQKKIGFQCHCTEEGKVLNPADNRTCIYQNRCSELPCSQICEVQGRASRYRYRCACAEGYEIEPDRQRICKHSHTSEEPELLVITRRHLRVYSLNGVPRQILASNFTNGVAIDFDIKTKRVFFSDVSVVGSTLAYIRRDVNDTENTYNVGTFLWKASPYIHDFRSYRILQPHPLRASSLIMWDETFIGPTAIRIPFQSQIFKGAIPAHS